MADAREKLQLAQNQKEELKGKLTACKAELAAAQEKFEDQLKQLRSNAKEQEETLQSAIKVCEAKGDELQSLLDEANKERKVLRLKVLLTDADNGSKGQEIERLKGELDANKKEMEKLKDAGELQGRFGQVWSEKVEQLTEKLAEKEEELAQLEVLQNHALQAMEQKVQQLQTLLKTQKKKMKNWLKATSRRFKIYRNKLEAKVREFEDTVEFSQKLCEADKRKLQEKLRTN